MQCSIRGVVTIIDQVCWSDNDDSVCGFKYFLFTMEKLVLRDRLLYLHVREGDRKGIAFPSGGSCSVEVIVAVFKLSFRKKCVEHEK